ncbi:MAG: hypothetical protein R3F33_05590 [Planctomycetota bacterium]
MSYDPHPIRWIDLVLPHPDDPNRRLTLKADGPFALRSWYYAPGTRKEIHLHLDQRTPEGGLKGCLHCAAGDLRVVRKAQWGLGLLAALPGAIAAVWWPAPGIAWAVLALATTWMVGEREIVCGSCGTQHRGFRLPGQA